MQRHTRWERVVHHTQLPEHL
eukprot:COSAG01_NODE_56042_length_321_cov_0.639640_1_plen_20_part_01